MSYSGDTPLLGNGQASAAQIQAWFAARGPDYAPGYAPDKTYQPAPPDLGQAIIAESQRYPNQAVNSDLVAAQILLETAGWQSKYARERNNPGGIGAINSNPDEALTFSSVEAGVRAHVAHLLNYAIGAKQWAGDDPRTDAIRDAGWLGSATRIADLNGKWAFPGTTYGQTIAALANQLLTFPADQTGGAPVVDISGFVPPQIIQQWFPVNGVSYLGLDMTMGGACIHETGNTAPSAEAQQNVNYMSTPECISRQASWHATVGLATVIETIPQTKQSYHASDGVHGLGNTTRKAIEGVMCYQPGTPEFARVMQNHAWYAAKSLREAGLPLSYGQGPTGTLAQHNDYAFDHKDCPQFYRDDALWGQFCAYAQAFYDRNEWAAPAPIVVDDGLYLLLPDGSRWQYAYRRGFKGFVLQEAYARYSQDINAAALSLFGYPKENEWLGKDGCVYQETERTLLQFNPGLAVPFDIVQLPRTLPRPEAA